MAEFAAMFALSVFLVRLAILWLAQIWWILLILCVIAIGGIIGWRVWKQKGKW
ncbi:MAG: hypothetical protein LBS03_09280 [Bacteroidales bacterium]|nr:hypothetical protein [Bacteroidales bacterium]